MKLFLLIVALLAVNLAAQTPKPATPKHECKAAANEWCPPDAWWKDYQRVQAFNAKYAPKPPAQPPQDEVDLIRGITDRLVGQIPPGYTWDPKLEKAVKNEPPKPPEAPKPEKKK